MASNPPDTQLGLFLKELGASLRAARTKAHLSLQGAADYLGVTKAAVGHWETGTNPIGADKLFRLARRYGTTVSALVSMHITKADLAALILSLDVGPLPAPKPDEEAITASGLPVTFVERRSNQPIHDPNVKHHRGIRVINNPLRHDDMPMRGELRGGAHLSGPLRRHGDKPTPNPHLPTKPPKRGK